MTAVIDIFTTGGTIDKVYFDALSEFQIGPAAIPDMLRENNVLVPHRVTQLMRKDSLELDDADREAIRVAVAASDMRSEEHTSELQSLMRISYAVFCLKKKQKQQQAHKTHKCQQT